MQVTQTLAEGLTRQFKVVIPATDLESRLTTELDQLKGRIRLNGFRPGKVPMAHLKRVYGRSAMAEVLQNAVTEANKKIVEDNALKLATEPKVTFSEDRDAIENVMAGKADLDFTVAVETLPSIELKDHAAITIEREVAEVPQEDVETAIQRMAESNRTYEPRAADAPAEMGDKVTMDFIGSIDGVPFDGGAGEDVEVVLGSGAFIPGFEEQLIGTKAGDELTVTATFPAEYQAPALAGKEAKFATRIKQVAAAGPLVVDDSLAEKFGIESLDKLKEAVRDQMAGDLAAASRQKVKRKLLDAMDELYAFDLPPSLLEQEFQSIWKQMTEDMQRQGQTFESQNMDPAETEAEYRRIATRRVRLGLVLAEIGEKAQVKVSDDEITQALISRARQFPGQEKKVFDFYRENPQALAELRAPLFEERVVDHILSTVTMTDKPVSRTELLDEEPGAAA